MNKARYINLSDITICDLMQSAVLVQDPSSKSLVIGLNPVPSESGFFKIFPYFGTKTLEYSCEKLVVCKEMELIEFLADENIKSEIEFKYSFDEKFVEDLEYCLEKIRKEEVNKLVPVTFAQYNIENGFHPLGRLEELVKLNGNLYGFWNNSSGFLGVSPEPIIYKENSDLKTIALAGTSPSDKTHLLKTEKELKEHYFVVNDIKEKFNQINCQIEFDEPEVIDFGKISHLKTKIKILSKSINLEKAVNILSPTAALGGYPSDKVFGHVKNMQYFNFEGDKRIFGGVIGLDNSDYCFGLVAIRNIFWENATATIHSGCGVVAQSVKEHELLEVRRKRQTISKIYEKP